MNLIYIGGTAVVAFLLGFITGVTYKNRRNITLEKLFSVVITIMYLIMIGYGRFYDPDGDIPISFDILGSGAAAHLIGLRLGEEVKKYLKSNNKQGKS